MSNLVLSPPASPVAPEMPVFTSEDEWEEYGHTLAHAEGNVNWFWGGWLNAHPKVAGHGHDETISTEVYDRAEQITSRSRETLRQLARVDRDVPSGTRVPLLPWVHHREVAPLTPAEQQHYLNRCLTEAGPDRKHLSVDSLRG